MYPAVGGVSDPRQQKCQGLPRSGGDSTATRGVHGRTERHRTFGVYGQFDFISSWFECQEFRAYFSPLFIAVMYQDLSW